MSLPPLASSSFLAPRNLASIAEVISGGEDVSKALVTLVEPHKDAPPQFRHLASHLSQTATLLACTLHLARHHQALLKSDLLDVLADVNSHFGVIQDSIRKWIRAPRARWRRLKWLYWSGRLVDLIRKLQALMSCLDVLTLVATIAVDNSQEDVEAWKLVLHRSQALRAVEEGRSQTGHLYRLHSDREPLVDPPRAYRSLFGLPDSSRDIAEWMSTVLSAPAVPLKGAAGGPPPPGIVKYERSKYPFAPTTRPEPESDPTRCRLVFPHRAVHLPALGHLGLQYIIEDDDHQEEEHSRKVLISTDKALKSFEVDLIISMSQVMKARPGPEWKVTTSPWMRLNPNEVLGRLLKSWTLLRDDEIDWAMSLPAPNLHEAPGSVPDSTHGEVEAGTAGGGTVFKLAPEPEGEEFNRNEFERCESLRDWDWNPHSALLPSATNAMTATTTTIVPHDASQRFSSTMSTWGGDARLNEGGFPRPPPPVAMHSQQPHLFHHPPPPLPLMVGPRPQAGPFILPPAPVPPPPTLSGPTAAAAAGGGAGAGAGVGAGALMPTLLESALGPTAGPIGPVPRRESIPASMDATWVQGFQDRVELRERILDLERKLEYAKEEAKVSAVELENKLSYAEQAEKDAAAKLEEQTETRGRLEKEIKQHVTVERVKLESNLGQSLLRVLEMEKQAKSHLDKVLRQVATQEANVQFSTSQRILDARKEVDIFKGEMKTLILDMLKKAEMLRDEDDEKNQHTATRSHHKSKNNTIDPNGMDSHSVEEVQLVTKEDWSSMDDEIRRHKEAENEVEMNDKLMDMERKNAELRQTLVIERLKVNAIERATEERVRGLTEKIKHLKSRKGQLKGELERTRDEQLARIQVERDAARVDAMREFEITLQRSAMDAVQKEMDGVIRKSSASTAAMSKKQGVGGLVVELASSEVADKVTRKPSMTVTEPEDSIVVGGANDLGIGTAGGINVMSYVVAEPKEEWTDAEEEPVDAQTAILASSELDGDDDRVSGIPVDDGDTPTLGRKLEKEEPQSDHTLTAVNMTVHLSPRVEDFLVPPSEDGNVCKTSEVLVSRPWKGMVGIEPPTFHGISPLYTRGNGLGETLYYGSTPIHIRELIETYTIDGIQQYLTISPFFLDPQVLDSFGVDYFELDNGQLSLDPDLSASEITKLFHESYSHREIEAFKCCKNQYKAGVFAAITNPDHQSEDGDGRGEYGHGRGDDGEEESEDDDDDEAEQDRKSAAEARALLGGCRQF